METQILDRQNKTPQCSLLKRLFGRAITLDDVNQDRAKIGESPLEDIPQEFTRRVEHWEAREIYPPYFSGDTYHDLSGVDTFVYVNGLLSKRTHEELRSDGSIRSSRNVIYEPPGSWIGF